MSRSPKRRAAKAVGMRSGFELEVSQMLEVLGMTYDYELECYEWSEKVPRAKCGTCGEAAYAARKYTPDFFLENGVILEAKGRFTAKDRKIALAMRAQGRDVRMVFMFDNRLSAKSTTRYSQWCDKNDIRYAIREVPNDWCTI